MIPPSSSLAEKFPRYKQVTIVREHIYTDDVNPINTPGDIFPNTLLDLPDYEIWQFTYMTDIFTTGKMNYPVMGIDSKLLMYNIFLPTSIHNIIISKIVYKMFKKWIYATKPLTTNATSQTISIVDLKFPVEYVFFGVRLSPIDTTVLTPELMYYKLEDYHRFTRIVRNVVVDQNFSSNQLYRFMFSSGISDDERLIPEGFRWKDIVKYDDIKIYLQAGSIKAQQVAIWDQQPTHFTNNYLAYKKGDLITSIED